MTTSGTPAASCEFACAVCGTIAGIVHLFVDEDRARVKRISFTSAMDMPVQPGTLALLRQAIADADASALYRCDRELASFYCPECAKAYCGAHWQRRDVFEEDGWHDEIRGTCPAGHERLLED